MEEEYYIEDEDLVVLLKDVFGDNIADDDIEKILDASIDDEITEEDFDQLVDEILIKSKAQDLSTNPKEIFHNKVSDEEEYLDLSNSQDRCPVCGGTLINENYCPVCNLKFSFGSPEEKNP